MKLTMTDSVREISILLVTARDNSAISAADIADHMPMGLGHIASYIKKNSKHKVSIIDVPHEDVDFEYLKNYIIKNKIELVGISAMVNNYIFCVDFSHYLRKFFPNIKIALGGAFPSTLPEVCKEDCSVNIVVKGAGETAFLDIANNIDSYNGIGKDAKVVTGLIPPSIDDLPWPDWNAMKHWTYKYPPPWSAWPVISSRGCPFNCKYCYKILERTYKVRDLDDLMAEIKYLVKNMNLKEFMMMDDLFFLKPQRVKDFCKKLIDAKLNLTWSAVSRVDLLDEEAIQLLGKAGCISVAVGVESGSQTMLKKMGKTLSLEKSATNLSLMNDYGIRIQPYIIVGYPGETKETLKETEDFLIKNRIYSAMTYCFPFPGTQLWNIALEKGMIPDIREYLRQPDFGIGRPHYNFTDMKTDELVETIEGMKRRVMLAYIENYIRDKKPLIEKAESIYIYGSGFLGTGVYDKLEDMNFIRKVKSFLDDDPKRQGVGYKKLPVIPLNKSKLESSDVCIIANSFFPETMIKKLKDKNPSVPVVSLVSEASLTDGILAYGS